MAKAKKRKRGLGMLVQKHGKIVDIPVRAGTVVRLRSGRNGTLTDLKAVVVGQAPSSAFSRAYGRQVYVCSVNKSGAHVREVGAGDVYPVGRAKRVPKMCKDALDLYYPDRKKRSRR